MESWRKVAMGFTTELSSHPIVQGVQPRLVLAPFVIAMGGGLLVRKLTAEHPDHTVGNRLPRMNHVQLGKIRGGKRGGKTDDLSVQRILDAVLFVTFIPRIEIHGGEDLLVVCTRFTHHDPDRARTLAQQMLVRPAEQEAVGAAFAHGLDHEVVPAAQHLANDLYENGPEADVNDMVSLSARTAEQV